MTQQVDEKIRPFVEAAIGAGFHVYILDEKRPPGAGFAYACLDPDGPFATISRPTHIWDPVELHVPIRPSRDYGSSVLADYDGTVEGALRKLRDICESSTVTVRFVSRKFGAPVVPNDGRNVLDKWPGGPDRFVELTAEKEE